MSRLLPIAVLATVLFASAHPARACSSGDWFDGALTLGIYGLLVATPAVEVDVPISERGPQALLTWPIQLPLTDGKQLLRLVLEPQWVLNHGDDPAFQFRTGARFAFFAASSDVPINPFVGLGGTFAKASSAISGELGMRFPKLAGSYVVARVETVPGVGTRTGLATGISFF